MHFHRVHSGKISSFGQKNHGNGHARITANGQVDRRTKAWREAHPRLAKHIGPKDAIDRALEHFADPATPKLECPQCHYDLNILTSSTVPNKVCPGCGTPFQTLVDRLNSLLSA